MDISKIGTERIQNDNANNGINKSQNSEVRESGRGESQSSNSATNAAGSAQSNAQSNAAAKVKWSSDARMAEQIDKTARSAPDVRADRVAALKAAIADGSYKVDARGLADKMIESSLKDDLLTRG